MVSLYFVAHEEWIDRQLHANRKALCKAIAVILVCGLAACSFIVLLALTVHEGKPGYWKLVAIHVSWLSLNLLNTYFGVQSYIKLTTLRRQLLADRQANKFLHNEAPGPLTVAYFVAIPSRGNL